MSSSVGMLFHSQYDGKVIIQPCFSHHQPGFLFPSSKPLRFFCGSTRRRNRCRQKTGSSARTGRCLHPDPWRDNSRDSWRCNLPAAFPTKKRGIFGGEKWGVGENVLAFLGKKRGCAIAEHDWILFEMFLSHNQTM